MKNIFLMLCLGFALPLHGQRSTTVMPRQTEPTLPYAIEGEAKSFLQAFQETVKFLADKNNSEDQKRFTAASAVKEFAKGAIIQIANGFDFPYRNGGQHSCILCAKRIISKVYLLANRIAAQIK